MKHSFRRSGVVKLRHRPASTGLVTRRIIATLLLLSALAISVLAVLALCDELSGHARAQDLGHLASLLIVALLVRTAVGVAGEPD